MGVESLSVRLAQRSDLPKCKVVWLLVVHSGVHLIK